MLDAHAFAARRPDRPARSSPRHNARCSCTRRIHRPLIHLTEGASRPLSRRDEGQIDPGRRVRVVGVVGVVGVRRVAVRGVGVGGVAVGAVAVGAVAVGGVRVRVVRVVGVRAVAVRLMRMMHVWRMRVCAKREEGEEESVRERKNKGEGRVRSSPRWTHGECGAREDAENARACWAYADGACASASCRPRTRARGRRRAFDPAAAYYWGRRPPQRRGPRDPLLRARCSPRRPRRRGARAGRAGSAASHGGAGRRCRCRAAASRK